MKATTKNIGKSTEEYLERESKANTSRRMSISNLDYIDFNENSIPILDNLPNENAASYIDSLRGLFGKKIVNLTGITNTDLKLSYGPSNLPALSEYDQNFTVLATAVYNLGRIYYEAGFVSEAVRTLSYGISIGTDICANYILLANIYLEDNNYSGIEGLITSAHSIPSLTRQSTIDKLESILSSHTALDLPKLVITDEEASSNENPDNILPADILDILGKSPYKSDDQKQ